MERRKFEAGTVVFDLRDVLVSDKRTVNGKKLIRMKKGPLTYESDEGTRFFKEHPFRWVAAAEADFLLTLPEEGYVYFVPATIEQVEDYYYS